VKISILRSLFWVLGSGFWILQFGCSSVPDWPAGANVAITREKNPGRIVSSMDVVIQQGRVPLARVRNGETIFGTLEEGTYVLTAVSQDPFAHSQFSAQVWASRPLQLAVKKEKRYRLMVTSSDTSTGWFLQLVGEE
jgi:hypothetical protein